MINANAQETAEIIRQQLGGGRFEAMTGAKYFSYDKKGTLNFKIGRNASSFNCVSIAVNSLDTYDMTFKRVTIKGCSKQEERNSIYSDNLKEVFESVTGLRTSL